MQDRRRFVARLAGTAACTSLPPALAAGSTLPLYASTGPELTLYDLSVDTASLTRRSSIRFPANVQYAWPHPSRKFLYIAASNGQPPSGPTGVAGGDTNHYAIACRIAADGSLTEHGERKLLPVRPLHISVDRSGRFLFIAYNIPSMVSVHRLNADGSIGDRIEQTGAPDFGIYAHQVLMTPSGRSVILCSRGNDATATRPEDPGHIEVFGFKDGQLSNLQKIAPGGSGIGFGPRHLDFSRDGRFVFVSLERENSLAVFAMNPDGTLKPEPLFVKNALADPNSGKEKFPGQGVGPIHVSPNGRFVYQTNRGAGTVDFNGQRVWNGGENSVVVWAIDPRSGEPTRIQNAPAHSFELRTFTIDPGAELLIAASTTPLLVHENGAVNRVSAGMTLYRIGPDGKLTFAGKTDVDTTSGIQFWCGLLNMP
jgi:6-phosphogluconolactonase (cycloisomerase 2 family)